MDPNLLKYEEQAPGPKIPSFEEDCRPLAHAPGDLGFAPALACSPHRRHKPSRCTNQVGLVSAGHRRTPAARPERVQDAQAAGGGGSGRPALKLRRKSKGGARLSFQASADRLNAEKVPTRTGRPRSVAARRGLPGRPAPR